MSIHRGMASSLQRFINWLLGKKVPQDPTEVFAAALEEFKDRYRKSRDLVADLLRERDQVRAALSEKRADLLRLREQARAALKAGDEPGALLFLEREKSHEHGVEDLERRLALLEEVASRAREALLRLNSEVERLERDRDRAGSVGQRAGAHRELQTMLRDIDDQTSAPALDRARSMLEHAELTEHFAQELDHGDLAAKVPARRSQRSAAERLLELKEEQ